jgi:hypothetical protein
MAYIPKIGIAHNAIQKRSELGELMELLFTGNPNQQYAALTMVLELKWSETEGFQELRWIMEKHGIPKRIFERARERLHKLGILEHATNLSGRTNGTHGWKLSSRFSCALKSFAEKWASRVSDKSPGRSQRDFAELHYIMKKY